jgi:hypothetical protein
MDALLEPFLNAPSGPESESLLAELLSGQANPIIRGIIRVKLHAFGTADTSPQGQDAGDVYSDVIAQLLVRLSALKSSPGGDAILDFRGYVAAATYNACHHYLRRKYPQRWRLKNRLRYLLTHRQEFAVWAGGGSDQLCGFALWRARGMNSPVGAGQLLRLRDDHGDFERTLAWKGDIRRAGLDDLVIAIFKWVGAPIEIDALVNTIADLQGLTERQVSAVFPDEDDATSREERLADPHASVADEMEKRSYLHRLWSEIVRLPLRQRMALLLNLRDLQEGVIALLPLTGVATLREIAEALAMSAEELAEMWNDLPLDDAAIAGRLGATRQQVINLRKSARARLARQMKAFDQ